MTLAKVPFDDLRWEDLVRLARDRLPSASNARWTLHAPVDPGITILEALAWQLEERLYRFGNLPESVFQRALELFDLEPPLPSRSASTVLRLAPDEIVDVAADDMAVIVVGGVQLRLGCRHPGRMIPDLVVESVQAAGREALHRLAELTLDPGLPGVGTVGLDGRLRLDVVLTSTFLSASTGGWQSLYLELEPIAAPRDSSTQRATVGWLEDASDDVGVHYVVDGEPSIALGPPWPLTWVAASLGTEFPIEVHDGTDGLRRSGVVRWRLPAESTVDRRVTLSVTSIEPWLGAEPRVRHIAPNVVAATHRRRAVFDTAAPDVQGNRELFEQLAALRVLPGERLQLWPLSDDEPVIADTVTLSVRSADGEWHEWRTIARLPLAGPDERVFEIDTETNEIVFGDDVHGRIPRFEIPCEAILSLDVGGGVLPRLSAVRPPFPTSSSWRWRVGVSDTKALNVVDLDGGRAPESIAAWTQSRPSRHTRRFVTPEDAARLATNIDAVDVARAHPEVGWDPEAPGWLVDDALTIFCVPSARTDNDKDLRREPILDPGSRRIVHDYLDGRRLTGMRVFVSGPAFRPVHLNIRLRREPQDSKAREAIATALRQRLHPTIGGSDGAGWTFGAALSPVALAHVARLAAAGLADVVNLELVVLPRRGCVGAVQCEDCLPIRIEPFELPWVERVSFSIIGVT